VDENGILSVSAYEHRSEAEATIEVRPSYGLTDDEVEEMVIASFEHAEADFKVRQLVEARVEADQVILATEKQLPLAEQFLAAGELSEQDMVRIRGSLDALREARGDEDARLIRTRIEELDFAAMSLVELVMNAAAR
jgi:molecular chaperone DnaK (HSP70)